MKLTDRHREAEQLANELLTLYGLKKLGWTFGWNKRRKQLALCFHHKKLISLSWYFVDREPRELYDDAIRHEIAHALLPVECGHNEEWRKMCLKVGAIPKRCSETVFIPLKYISNCSKCGLEYQIQRTTSDYNYYCSNKSCELTLLVWRLNERYDETK